MTAPSHVQEELGQLRRMRLASIAEGCTLLALVFVAVPLATARPASTMPLVQVIAAAMWTALSQR